MSVCEPRMDDSLFFCLCGQEVVHGDGGDVYGNLHIEQGKIGGNVRSQADT